MAENADASGMGKVMSTMRVVGRALGQACGMDYSVYLLQVDGGFPYLAVDHGESW